MATTETFTTSPNYTYTINPNTCTGTCATTGKRIYVIMGCTETQYQNVVRVSHPHYLKLLYPNLDKGHLVFEDMESSVKVCVDKWISKKRGRATVMKFKVPTGLADVEGIWVHYLPLISRQVIWQMVKVVCDLQLQGFSLGRFSLKDWRMDEGNWYVKFCGIDFTTNPTTTTRKEDYECLIRSIQDLTGRDAAACVDDLQNFFNLARQKSIYAVPTEAKLLKCHLAFLPPAYVLNFLIKCSENISKQKGRMYGFLSYMRIMKGIPNCNDWKSKFSDPRYNIIKSCYNYGSVQYNYKAGGGIRMEDVKNSLLKFVRNLWVHFNDTLHGTNDQLSDVQIHAVIMELFQREILATQIALFKEGVLNDFMVEM